RAFCRVTLYEARGDYQLVIQELREAGEGLLQKKFEELKQRLLAQGLFEQKRKRPLPAWPRRVAVITSASGAAVRDILTTLKRRFRSLPVVLIPVTVQGDSAAAEIAAALQQAGEIPHVDVVILARGGGSLEDLWPFNEEIVARAIEDCPVPVVSGIGHETDFTIADLVADVRAATPTAAAEAVSPDSEHLQRMLASQQSALTRAMLQMLEQRSYQLDQLTAQLIRPEHRIEAVRNLLPQLYSRLKSGVRKKLDHARLRGFTAHHSLQKHAPSAKIRAMKSSRLYPAMETQIRSDLGRRRVKLAKLTGELETASPLATLARGYTLVNKLPGGELVGSATQLQKNDKIRVRFRDGSADCLVEDIKP
ncbi:MAG: exodeoxyribonuclease VII large subunit, partial [Gammaproteobacteria bacterium]